MNRFELASKEISRVGGKTLLDVGCRDTALKRYLGSRYEYFGLDLFQNEKGTVDYVVDFEKGTDLPDSAFDVVAALDVVEHLDDFEGGLNELVRLARLGIVVMLPNLSHVFFRMRFLLEGRISGKYDLVFGMGRDRHRWFTVLHQTDTYMRNYAHRYGLTLEAVPHFHDSAKRRLMGNIGKALKIPPSWWVWSQLYVLRK